MRIPTGICLIWPSTHASIPTNWERETSFDALFAKVWGSVAVNTTGGNATHSHTSPTHRHQLVDHTHSITLEYVSATDLLSSHNWQGLLLQNNHYHTVTSGSMGTVYTEYAQATYGACSNNPPYIDVIYIRALTGALLENGICGLWNKTTVPTGWSEYTSARDRFLRGAGTNADGGATGGSSQNVHNISHTHTIPNHAHAQTTSTQALGIGTGREGTTASSVILTSDHAHAVSLDSGAVTMNSDTLSLATGETVEPLYYKLALIQKGASGIKEKDIIGLWLGALENIPKGWYACDGQNGTPDLRDRYIKIAGSLAQVGAMGGSNTHVHAQQLHTHSTQPHTHSATVQTHDTVSTPNNEPKYQTNTEWWGSNKATVSEHAATVASVNMTMSSTYTSADSANNEPLHRTAIYIQYKKDVGGAGTLVNFL